MEKLFTKLLNYYNYNFLQNLYKNMFKFFFSTKKCLNFSIEPKKNVSNYNLIK